MQAWIYAKTIRSFLKNTFIVIAGRVTAIQVLSNS